MDEQKRPTPERRRLSLTQAALGRPIPKGLELALGMKAWSDNVLHVPFRVRPLGCTDVHLRKTV